MYSHEYYVANKDKYRANSLKYREAHKERVKAANRKYYEKNKDKIIAYSHEYRKNNMDKVRAEYSRWYKDNKDKAKEYSREYQHAHPERYRKKAKESYKIAKSQGICVRCHKAPAREGRTDCEACALKRKAYWIGKYGQEKSE